MSAHTPTPWKRSLLPWWIVGPEGLEVAMVAAPAPTLKRKQAKKASKVAYANADYIVLCVNAHEQLLRQRDALITALLEINTIDRKGKRTLKEVHRVRHEMADVARDILLRVTGK